MPLIYFTYKDTANSHGRREIFEVGIKGEWSSKASRWSMRNGHQDEVVVKGDGLFWKIHVKYLIYCTHLNLIILRCKFGNSSFKFYQMLLLVQCYHSTAVRTDSKSCRLDKWRYYELKYQMVPILLHHCSFWVHG